MLGCRLGIVDAQPALTAQVLERRRQCRGSPRAVELPADFAAALAADERAAAFFEELSNSLQRYHIDTITAAKSADTRQRRLEKAVALFRDGTQR